MEDVTVHEVREAERKDGGLSKRLAKWLRAIRGAVRLDSDGGYHFPVYFGMGVSEKSNNGVKKHACNRKKELYQS